MTDEDLEKELTAVCDSIDNLPQTEEPLPKEVKKRRELLSLQKATLEKIKEAKKEKANDAEMHNSMIYGMLTSWWGNHLFLLHLMVNARLRGMRY